MPLAIWIVRKRGREHKFPSNPDEKGFRQRIFRWCSAFRFIAFSIRRDLFFRPQKGILRDLNPLIPDNLPSVQHPSAIRKHETIEFVLVDRADHGKVTSNNFYHHKSCNPPEDPTSQTKSTGAIESTCSQQCIR